MIKIKIDSREKMPYTFGSYDVEIETAGLKTGDITVEGLEDVLIFERKKSSGEISLNIGSGKKAFVAELERMKSFKYKYLVLEFSLQDVLQFPTNSSIPQKHWNKLRISSNYMMSFLDSLSEKYGIEVVYAGNREEAERLVMEIIGDVLDKERNDSGEGKDTQKTE